MRFASFDDVVQCRACGLKCKGYTHKKYSEQCKTALLSVFGIDVGEESEAVYPHLRQCATLATSH